jgi:hypothetical protein
MFPVGTSISGDTGSETAFEAIVRWFKTCVKEHKTLCSPLVPPGGAPKLPLRVLEVGADASAEIRLVETQGRVGYWACLSHCWDGQQPLTTTRNPDTLSQHLVAIRWEALPKTFQEAIIVTRRFGIPFLWIDSLSIIQDDFEDWQTQSAQMAYIYQNSVLTIAGSASAGPHQGLFRRADPSYLDTALGDNVGQTKLGNIRTRKALVHNASQLPLMQRCWVHQERLLSPRYVHFSHHEIIWECSENLMCECGGIRRDHPSQPPIWPGPKHQMHTALLQSSDWMARLGHAAWHAVVTDYSRMNLTNAMDIFPAISGLAKSVVKSTGWSYVAGLWEENLIVDLVWMTVNPRLATRNAPWRAPTFSWASIMSTSDESGRGWISYRYVENLRLGLAGKDSWGVHFYASFVEAECVPQGDDPTGRLLSAHIILKGSLIRVTVCRAHNKWEIAATGKEPKSRDTFHMDFDLVMSRIQDSEENTKVFLLKLVGCKKNINYADEEFVVYLVLRKVDMEIAGPVSTGKREERTFERIGLLTSRKDEVHIDEESDVTEIEHNVRMRII